jgi:uncharacterized RDD family membrane protein YckC
MPVTCPRCGWQGEAAQYCARCGASLVTPGAPVGPTFPPPVQPTITPYAPYPARPQVAVRPAGFWIRFVALVIDGFFLLLVQAVLIGLGWLLWGEGTRSGTAVAVATHLFNWIISNVYTIVFHWRWGQTFGKMLMQIRVVRMDGGPLSLGQSIGRYFATILSTLTLGIGFIMAGARSDKRALHDLLAGTRVERL